MKIIKEPAPISLQIELEYEEICGICKMIGATSVTSRQQNFNLTEEESEKLSVLFMALSEFVSQEDR